jgi:hypothetical protein
MLRDGKTIPVFWVLLNAVGLDREDARQRVKGEASKKQSLSNVETSARLNLSSTLLALKVPGATLAWWDRLPASIRSRMVRIYDQSDHAELKSLLRQRGWNRPTEE